MVIQGGKASALATWFTGVANRFQPGIGSALRWSIRQNPLKHITNSAVTFTCFSL
jgi:hypothetical protein